VAVDLQRVLLAAPQLLGLAPRPTNAAAVAGEDPRETDVIGVAGDGERRRVDRGEVLPADADEHPLRVRRPGEQVAYRPLTLRVPIRRHTYEDSFHVADPGRC
jgi:hypothetical protein